MSGLNERIKELESEKQELTVSLEQLDQDCQRTTEKLLNLKDALQHDYDQLKLEFADLKKENGILLKEVANKDRLLKKLEFLKTSARILNETREVQTAVNEAHGVREDFEILPSPDQTSTEKKEILTFPLKLTDDKSETALEDSVCTGKDVDVQTEHDSPQNFNEINRLNSKLKQMLGVLENEISDTKKKYEIALEERDESRADLESRNLLNTELNEKLGTTEKTIFDLNMRYRSLLEEKLKVETVCEGNERHKVELKSKILQLENSIESLKTENEDLARGKDDLHFRYVNIVLEMFKKVMDYPLPLEIKLDKPSIDDFLAVVETILRLLLDYEWKIKGLQEELKGLNEGKTNIIDEKNQEIEKLMKNSRFLCEEVMVKSQELKHYENECTELSNNNDMLIAQLDMFKTKGNGLQTISESNEDNVLHLETLLESANKRIKELEMTIAAGESKDKVEVGVSSKNNINDLENEAQQSLIMKAQCDGCLKVQNENNILQNTCDETLQSNNGLTIKVDELQIDLDTTKRQLTEKIDEIQKLESKYECLQRDILDLQSVNDKLTNVNFEYESKNDLLQNKLEELVAQFEEQMKLKDEFEILVRNLSEKLQSAKMTETSLKLQNDTLRKELINSNEQKQNLIIRIESASTDIESGQKEIERLQNCNADVDVEVKNLKTEHVRLMQENEELLKYVSDSQELKIIEYEQQLNQISKTNLENITRENESLVAKLKYSEEMVTSLKEEVRRNADKQKSQTLELEKELGELKANAIILNNDLSNRTHEIAELKEKLNEVNESNIYKSNEIDVLRGQYKEAEKSKNELVYYITIKQEENIKYHAEIQRLNQILISQAENNEYLQRRLDEKSMDEESELQSVQLEEETSKQQAAVIDELIKKDLEIEKLVDQNNFLREKCGVVTENLLQEQSNCQKLVTEKNNTIAESSRELERLRKHLLEVEEMYTKELLLAESKNQEMQFKIGEIEQREKESGALYTSVNIRTNQQMETLHTQLALVTSQRDDLNKKISDFEDKVTKQATSLLNLQLVLEQFQKGVFFVEFSSLE